MKIFKKCPFCGSPITYKKTQVDKNNTIDSYNCPKCGELQYQTSLAKLKQENAFYEIVKIFKEALPQTYRMIGININPQDYMDIYLNRYKEEIIRCLRKNRKELIRNLKLL